MNLQKKTIFPFKDPSLPLSQPTTNDQPQLLRRRLSSLSLNIQPISSFSFPRSKSVSAMGEQAGSSIKKWWELGWNWIMSRKPILVADLEMSKDEAKVLGSHNKGSWRHVWYKIRSEVRRLFGSDNEALPQFYARNLSGKKSIHG